MEGRIRPLQDSDIAASLMLWRHVEGLSLREDSDQPAAIKHFLARNPGLSFVADAPDGTLIGSVLCGHDGRRGFVYHLAVSPGSRRKLCASSLLNASLRGLALQGITRCHAFVHIDNQAAQGFWRHVRGELRRDIGVYTIFIEPVRTTPALAPGE